MNERLLSIIVPAVMLAAILVAFFIFVHRFGAVKDRRRPSFSMSAVVYYCSYNFVPLILLCMLSIPLLLQIIYSIPLCVPAVASGDVITFWGVMIGLIGGGFSIAERDEIKERKREAEVQPRIRVETSRDGVSDDKHRFKIQSESNYPFTIIKFCDVGQNVALKRKAVTFIDIQREKFASFVSAELARRSKINKEFDADKEPKSISIELLDCDGRTWHIDFSFTKAGWKESFRFMLGL